MCEVSQHTRIRVNISDRELAKEIQVLEIFVIDCCYFKVNLNLNNFIKLNDTCLRSSSHILKTIERAGELKLCMFIVPGGAAVTATILPSF